MTGAPRGGRRYTNSDRAWAGLAARRNERLEAQQRTRERDKRRFDVDRCWRRSVTRATTAITAISAVDAPDLPRLTSPKAVSTALHTPLTSAQLTLFS